LKKLWKSVAADLDRATFEQFGRGLPEKYRRAAEVATKAADYKANRGDLTPRVW
jgi:hypothetical protein